MTIAQAILKHLEDNGLWGDEPAKVLAAMKASPANEAMQGRWDDDVAGYPAPLMAVLIMGANRAAVEWIDANKPKHFARAMFAR